MCSISCTGSIFFNQVPVLDIYIAFSFLLFCVTTSKNMFVLKSSLFSQKLLLSADSYGLLSKSVEGMERRCVFHVLPTVSATA